jgi:hypothetical protein
VIGNAHPSHSPSASNRTRAPSPSLSSVITHEPVACGSNTIVPSTLVTRKLQKPTPLRWVLQVAAIREWAKSVSEPRRKATRRRSRPTVRPGILGLGNWETAQAGMSRA